VGDLANGVRLALETDAALGQILNLCETRTGSIGLWARQILDAAGSDADLVRVPDSVLPDDLRLTGAMAQHLLADAAKARSLLSWAPSDPLITVRRSVQWHLNNPPIEPDPDFAADERALTAAS
jgi:nucleoside-diphosphate-sugar epimerase